MTITLLRLGSCLLAALLVAPRPAAAQQSATPRHEIEALIREAVTARLGGPADVDVVAIDLPEAPAVYREARPDSVARFGRPMRFALVTDAGRSVYAQVELRVVADQVVVRQPVGRGHLVGADDIESVRQELVGTLIRPLPGAEDVRGALALRPLEPGQLVEANFVKIPRAVEAGDRVTVVAVVGAVRVTATFVAADGGDVGDVIRVSNPDTRRVVKGRIVGKGLIEVIHED